MRLPRFKDFLEQLGTVPGNVASIQWNPDTGQVIGATFHAPVAASVAAPASVAVASAPARTVPEKPVDLVPGTVFPDDKSGIDFFDLLQNPPKGLAS